MLHALLFGLLVSATRCSLSSEVLVGLRQRNLDLLEELFWQVATPGNSEYLKFRSVEHLASIIGASDRDIARAKQWLINSGANVESLKVSPLQDSISATFGAHGILSATNIPAEVEFVIHRSSRSTPLPHATSRLRDTGVSRESYAVENIKKAYGIPLDLKATNVSTLQMVWGPGTFGYSLSQLEDFKASQCPLLNEHKVKFDTKNHGKYGDNYMEGNLDTQMIAAFGLNVETLVSNTNTSTSTEEGEGFGQALLDFLTSLASRDVIPQVLSLSLGSLSAYSCDLLVSKCQNEGDFSEKDIRTFLQMQRQVCMFLSRDQVKRINTGFQLLGLRGVSVFASSGDGGSHFSFEPFSGGGIADALNKVSCSYQIPVFPTTSPYVISVGGTAWSEGDSSKPIAWSGSGGGFSWEFGAPDHQKDAVLAYLKGTPALPPTTSFNASGRAYPDISAIGIHGTSQSSPMAAGIFSLVNDHRLNAGLPSLGFLGPRLYQVMTKASGEAFQSVNSGDTNTTCDNGFPAKQGWDPVTGWGQPRWQGLLEHFGSDTALQTANIVV